nr:MBL fold metallo-hydrolase [Sphingomonas quercus]
MIEGYPNAFIVTGSAGTLVVDTGMGTPNGRFVAQAAARVSRGGKLYLAVTHEHPEHAAGFAGFPPGTILLRSQAQQRDLETAAPGLLARFRQRSPEWARLLEGAEYGKASELFDHDYRLNLGDVTVRLVQVPPAHTNADLVAFVETDGALISGDVVQNRTVPNPIGSAISIASWLKALDEVAALNPRLVLPDHSAPAGGDMITEQRAFFVDVQKRAAAAKRAGRSAEELLGELRGVYGGWQNAQNLKRVADQAFSEAG